MITRCMNTCHERDLGHLSFYRVGDAWPGRRKLLIRIITPYVRLIYAVYAVRVFMKSVIAELMTNIKVNQERARNAHCESRQIDQGKQFLSLQVSDKIHKM